ncbi:MAG: diacylglycerol kinase family protein [Peptococcaceae bacterium]|nr:diacylglycerol kinase family protein [Peptococcaceae bacterium]
MSQFKEKPSSFLRSCQGACKGIFHSLKTEKHLRFHFFASFVVITAGFYLKISGIHWLFITYAIGSVIAAELFNTALERVVDLVQPGYHPIAGIAKDIAAGAVLVTAIQSVVIGIMIFGPYFY